MIKVVAVVGLVECLKPSGREAWGGREARGGSSGMPLIEPEVESLNRKG